MSDKSLFIENSKGLDLSPIPDESSTKEEVRFNFHDYVAPFHPENHKMFKSPPEDGKLIFRSCISWYPCLRDQTPLILRDRPGRRIKPAFTYEAVSAMNEDRKTKELKHLALSCNLTEEDAILSLTKKLKELVNQGLPKDEIDALMVERGLYIAKFMMMPSHGLITEFENGHGNILLYEGVNFKDMIIPGFEPTKFKYEV